MARGDRTERGAALRESDTVMPLELFFDLVFVLAITQTTALMADQPTWTGIAKGMLVLAVMWWAWVGYSWLTSVVDPEAGVVRLAIAAAIAGLLICAICIPDVFGDDGLLFAGAYLLVRVMQLVLFMHAAVDDPHLRRSIIGLAVGTLTGTGLLVAASFTDGALQATLWAIAVVADFGGAIAADASGWTLRPHHFAERHGLIIIIALGESLVAIGASASEEALTTPVVAAAVLGSLLAFAAWWLYFDVVALVATRRLVEAEPGLSQNKLARDSYSYGHLPMVAGIVLVALGLKKTVAHVDKPLEIVPAAALLGGFALYLAGHLWVRWRNVRTIDRERYPTATALNRERLAFALLLLAAIPLAGGVDALVLLALLTAATAGLIALEVRRQGYFRRRLRTAMVHTD